MSQAYSVHTFAGMLGSAAAPGAVLFMHGLYGWRGAFLGAAALGLLAALVLLFTPGGEAASSAPSKPAPQAPAPTDWRLLLTRADPGQLRVLPDLCVRQLRPAELLGGGARPALRHRAR